MGHFHDAISQSSILGHFFPEIIVEMLSNPCLQTFRDHGIIAFIDIPLEQVIVADRKLLRRAVQHLMPTPSAGHA